MEQIKTTCPYCGVGCGLTVARDASGIKISGDPDHPANFGRLCSKGSALDETLDLDNRLLHPQVDGRLSDWGTALDTVAQRFSAIIAEHGSDAVAFYASGQMLTEDYYVANKLMKGFIGSANIDTNSRLCMSSAVAAYKRAFGSDTVPCSYEDLERAKLIVLTGSNTAWCHPVIYQRIVRAKRENPDLQVVVIDPRRTATYDSADLHLPLKPGSDAVLFNGLLAWLQQHDEGNTLFTSNHCEGVEEALATAAASAPSVESVAQQCALPVEEVVRFYRLFARTERVVTLYSQGINQSSSGTDKANAIINCHLYTGRLGRPGMGPFSMTGQPNAMGGREVGGLANQLAAHMELDNAQHRALVQRFWNAPRIADRAGLKAVELFEAIEQGKVKALWIMATNPLVSLPAAGRVKAALQKCELVVVSDCMDDTDTIQHAHIRLPALAWGEKSGTVTNSERRISRQRAFLAPPGEAKADWWIVSEVAKRMGFAEQFSWHSPAEIFSEYAKLTAYENNNTRDLDLGGLAELGEQAYDSLKPVQWPIRKGERKGATRLFADGRFYTPSGKARLVAVTPRPPQSVCSTDYPLRLNTGRIRDQWHTMTRSGKAPRLANHLPEPLVTLHPDDAARYQINDGSFAELRSPYGAARLRATVSSEVLPGSLFVPMHWNDRFAAQACINALVAPQVDPVSGQPESKHAVVAIAPLVMAWQGLLISRRRLTIDRNFIWSASRTPSGWCYRLAGESTPDDWARAARAILCSPQQDVGWIEYLDNATNRYRAARLANGRLESCLFVGPQLDDSMQEWLETLFARDQLGDGERLALLSGRAPANAHNGGRIVCACHGVGENDLKAAIAAGAASVEALGIKLKAGTNCGSCVPELKRLLTGAAPV
ncbi:MAG TPA: molybdopterin-dependent oxidoreductase [Gammaproteobacteria bacterium]